MVRIIHSSLDYQEQVYFTQDLDSPATDFTPPGWTIESDTKHDIDLPSSFPFENAFSKES